MSIKAHLAQSRAFTPTQPRKTDAVIAKGLLCSWEIIVFTKKTSEIGDLMETRVRSETTTVGVDVLKGDFGPELGERETLEVGFSSPSAAARRSQLRRSFALANICVSRFQEHLLVPLLVTN